MKWLDKLWHAIRPVKQPTKEEMQQYLVDVNDQLGSYEEMLEQNRTRVKLVQSRLGLVKSDQVRAALEEELDMINEHIGKVEAEVDRLQGVYKTAQEKLNETLATETIQDNGEES